MASSNKVKKLKNSSTNAVKDGVQHLLLVISDDQENVELSGSHQIVNALVNNDELCKQLKLLMIQNVDKEDKAYGLSRYFAVLANIYKNISSKYLLERF